MIPAPADLGFPDKFVSWRPNQLQAIDDGISSKKRFVGQMALPGQGKSACYMAQAVITKSRTMILTSTKGLQDQLLNDFGSLGLVDIRGKSNYQCNAILGQSCEEGTLGKCMYKGSTACTWACAKDAAVNSKLVTTNYSCWLATNRFGMGFGAFDLLIMDEAHNAGMELAKAMQIHISDNEIENLLGSRWPKRREDMEEWKAWAAETRSKAETKVQALKERIEKAEHPSLSMIKDYKHYKNLARKLGEIAQCEPDKWISDKGDWGGYKFDPLDPSDYAERILFKGIPRVILTSGTITLRTLQSMGIPEDQLDYFEYEGKIKVGKSPLIFIPTSYITRNSTKDDLQRGVDTMDEIIELRPDRRGIVHTSNFKIRDFIMEKSQYSRFMISNYTHNGDVTSAVVKQFKKADPPVVLVTPSVSTGYDFMHDSCRYQIIFKLPFPDYFSSKVEREREKLDPKRGIHHMWQTLAQQYGRGDRAEDDWCECFILDNCIEKSMLLYGKWAPWWIVAVYKKMGSVPLPPDIN